MLRTYRAPYLCSHLSTANLQNKLASHYFALFPQSIISQSTLMRLRQNTKPMGIYTDNIGRCENEKLQIKRQNNRVKFVKILQALAHVNDVF